MRATGARAGSRVSAAVVPLPTRHAMRANFEDAGTDLPDAAEVDVCVCTFERPGIVDTLAALSRQTGLGRSRFRVVVVDNSHDGSARERVGTAAKRLGLDLTCIHAPAGNISIARNACLDAARGEWIAFVDDDERPVCNWLAQLLAEARRGDWSAVLGPVVALYPDSAPQWLRRGDFHSALPVWRNGEIRTAFSGNVLFRRALAESAGLRFRIDLGRTGGEDEDFFDRFRDAGGTLGFAPQAVCYERVAFARANLSWLLRRNFRAGQSHGARLLRMRGRPQQMLLASVKAAWCAVRAGLALSGPVARNRYLVRTALHCGVLARLSGIREIAMY